MAFDVTENILGNFESFLAQNILGFAAFKISTGIANEN